MTENVPNVLFKVHLTVEQFQVISRRLPKGYEIYPANRPLKRESTRNIVFKSKKPEASSESSKHQASRKKPQRTLVDKQISKSQKDFPIDDNDLMNRAPKNFTPDQKKCYFILQKLKRHSQASQFFKPQENWKHNDLITDYIDFPQIEANVKQGQYSSILQFWADVRKIWQNTYLTNPKESSMYVGAIEMDNYFTELYKEAEKPAKNNIKALKRQVDYLTQEITMMNQHKTVPPTQTNVKRNHPPPVSLITQPITKKPAVKNSKGQSKLEIPMTIQEKKNLGMNIRALPPEYLKGVWEIVSEGLNVQANNEELEFDIDMLPVKKTRLLERYVNSKIQLINRQSQKTNSQSNGHNNKPNEQIKQNQVTAVPPPTQTQLQYAVPQSDTAESSFSSDSESSA